MYRVLCIDDDASVREALRFSLEHLGYLVEEAEGGAHGLAMAKATPPDVILCDLYMPEMDGLSTLAALRRDPGLAAVPVIMISGSVGSSLEGDVKKAGADALVRKPYSLEGLGSILKECLMQKGL